MPHPLVVNIRKTDRYDVLITRATMWGNPFVITPDCSRREAIAQYEEYLTSRPDLMVVVPTLRGKILGCWCAPLPCHGDVLARLANGS